MTFEFDPRKAALLVVDMQKGFIEEGAAMEVPPGRNIIPNIQTLLTCCRNLDIPVIFTRFVYASEVPNLIGELHPQHKPPVSCCQVGDPSVEIVDDLIPSESELIIDKHGYDAFRGTPLDYALKSQGKNQLIFTGVMTDICVLATVTSALHHEYQSWTIDDATATLWEEVQATTIDLIKRAYGMVSTTSEMIQLLNH